MRTIPSGLLTMMQSRRLFLATLIQVDFPYTTKSGVSRLGFTDHDQPITVNFHGGSLTFSPEYLVEKVSFNSKINTAIDDTSLILKIDDPGDDSGSVNFFDIRTRAWHNAVVRVGHVDWRTPGNGTYIKAVYLVSNATVKGGKLTLELRGQERLLELPITKRLTANCQHTFGDSRCGINITPQNWAPNTAYLGSTATDAKAKTTVTPTTPNGFWYEASVGGTSHATTEPIWPTTLGGTIVDGTVTWVAIRPRRYVGTIATVTNRRSFIATGISVASDYFAKGRLLWLTGDNATMRMKVYSDDGAGALYLEEDTYHDIQIGDTFSVDVGCRKRIDTDCTTKFNNTINAWAFPFLVNENALGKAPKG